MSLLKKLQQKFCGGDEEHVKILEQGIGLLRLSSFYSLQKRYIVKYGIGQASAIAVAVVSRMILEPPADEKLLHFCEKNRAVVQQELGNVQKYEDLAGPSGCASYLFAAEIMHSKIVKAAYVTDATKRWKSAEELLEQAKRLGIPVPTSVDICGSHDKNKCIESIHSFAKVFYYTNTWTGTSPAVTDLSFPSIPFDYDFLAKVLLDTGGSDDDQELENQKEKGKEKGVPVYRLGVNH